MGEPARHRLRTWDMELDTAGTTCPECGHDPGTGRFCAYCGARVGAAPTPTGGTASAAPATDVAAGPTVAVVPATGAHDDDGVGEGADRPSRGRRTARVGALVLLAIAVAGAAWLQQPRLRAVERAGGLATYGGSTSADAAALDRVRWSTPLGASRAPADVTRVVADPLATSIVTDEAVWVLTPMLDRYQAELPRLRGVPRPGPAGTLALLDGDELLEVDPATAGIVRRTRLSRSLTDAATWAQPTSAGWGLHDGTTGETTFVHATAAGDHWTVPDVDVRDVVEVDGTIVLEARGGVQGHDVVTGERLWRVNGAAVAATGQGTIAVERPGGSLTGLSSVTGAPTWRIVGHELEVLGGNGAGVVVIEDDAAAPVITIDPTTGEVTSRFGAPPGEDGERPPVIRLLGDQLVADDGRQLTVFDPGGRVRWRLSTEDLLDVDADGDVVAVTDTRGTRILQGAFGEPYLPALPRHARAVDEDRPAVSGGQVQPVAGLVLDLATGEVLRGAAPSTAQHHVFGLGDGFWEQRLGRSIVTDPEGGARWQSGGSTVLLPLADTPRGVVAVLDDGALGAVRLVDPTTGVPTGTGVLDAGYVDAVPVSPDLVVGRWRDRATDDVWTVAIEVTRDGLAERWRSRERGAVVGLADDLVWLASPGRLVGVDADGGGRVRVVETPVLGTTPVLVEGSVALLTDTAVVGVPLDGSDPWQVRLDARPTSAPVVGGERLHVGLTDGTVLAIGADGALVGERQIGDRDVRSLVVADDVLLVRTAGRLVALGD